MGARWNYDLDEWRRIDRERHAMISLQQEARASEGRAGLEYGGHGLVHSTRCKNTTRQQFGKVKLGTKSGRHTYKIQTNYSVFNLKIVKLHRTFGNILIDFDTIWTAFGQHLANVWQTSIKIGNV